jgi:hypothetical protein
MVDIRIKEYNGEMVTFEYTDHGEKKKSSRIYTSWISSHRSIAHVPVGYLRMVRHYGIYVKEPE